MVEQKWWNDLVAERHKKINNINNSERPSSKTKNQTIQATASKTSIKGQPNSIMSTKSQPKKTTQTVQSTKGTNKNPQVLSTNKADCKQTEVRPSSNTALKPSSAEAKKSDLFQYTRKDKKNFDKINIQINLCLGRVYSKLKEIDKAKGYYDNVIKEEPNVLISLLTSYLSYLFIIYHIILFKKKEQR